MSTFAITPKMLVVFIDETGNEDFSDPNFPIFGRGGCAVIGKNYKKILEKPWRRLKREKLGGEEKPFHAVEFGQLPPTKAQIHAINSFLKGKFYRFFSMDHLNSNRPKSIDGHQTVSWTFQERLRKIARKLDIDSVVLIFESSSRANRLVERDFVLENLNIINKQGEKVEVDGCFMEKKL